MSCGPGNFRSAPPLIWSEKFHLCDLGGNLTPRVLYHSLRHLLGWSKIFIAIMPSAQYEETKAKLDITDKDLTELHMEKSKFEAMESAQLSMQEKFEKRMKEDMQVTASSCFFVSWVDVLLLRGPRAAKSRHRYSRRHLFAQHDEFQVVS